jgi:hypothetical protein
MEKDRSGIPEILQAKGSPVKVQPSEVPGTWEVPGTLAGRTGHLPRASECRLGEELTLLISVNTM